MPKRLFFALWPESKIRRRCADISQALANCGQPVAPTNLHVTLSFLGSIDATQQAAMTRAAADILVQPMKLVFSRLDYWKKPKIVCLTADQYDPVVAELAGKLNNAAKLAGIPVDERPFNPHVTLLRKAGMLPIIAFDPVVWRADGFCLLESRSSPNGVEYRILDRWRAGAGRHGLKRSAAK